VTIWISQWLCPERHCSIASAWDDQETTRQEVEERGQRLYREGKVNPWCGICGQDLKVEHGRTRFKTMAEAEPELRRLERENALARRLLGSK
jgi:hypothetical protein